MSEPCSTMSWSSITYGFIGSSSDTVYNGFSYSMVINSPSEDVLILLISTLLTSTDCATLCIFLFFLKGLTDFISFLLNITYMLSWWLFNIKELLSFISIAPLFSPPERDLRFSYLNGVGLFGLLKFMPEFWFNFLKSFLVISVSPILEVLRAEA